MSGLPRLRAKNTQKARRKGDNAAPLPYTNAKSAQWQDRWTFAQPAASRLGRAADGDFAMNLIQELEKEQFEKLSAGKEIPEFGPGDTVIVNVKVVEGDRSRVQPYERVCIGRSGAGLNNRFTLPKLSSPPPPPRLSPA